MHKGRVLVTGAAHRIGREVSLTLAKQGNSIALHYNKSKDSAELLAEEINSMGKGQATIYEADLSDISSIQQLIQNVASGGPIDHLVNNASAFKHDSLATMTSESFDAMIAINLKAPLFLSKEFVKYRTNLSESAAGKSLLPPTFPSITNMLDQKIASTNSDYLSYTVAKHGLHSLTEMLAKECAPMIRGKNVVFWCLVVIAARLICDINFISISIQVICVCI
jgi:NAD(P)-dependent dehydrogenase (short-subunit alcohol dehydrogenase family)